jgi:hypothetical protein
VTSGQSINTNILVTNNSTKELKYNITYRSNLQHDKNTVGLWYFEESSGSQIIDETRRYNGSLHGPTWTDGIFGKALHFDGVDDYALVSNFQPTNLSSISIETWINFESLEYWAPIGGVKFESFGLLYRDDGVFRTHIWGQEQGLKWYDTLKPIEFNEWHYIAMTFDSETGEISLYLDGVKIESRFEGPDTINDSFFDLLFGRGWTESMWHLLDGSIDEIRISNITRNKIEIAENYRRASTGQGEWLRFSDASGIIAQDTIHGISISLDASSLKPGIYQRNIIIKTDNPQYGYENIPVTLEVIPAVHDIALKEVIIPTINLAQTQTPIDIEIVNLGSYNETNLFVLLIADGIHADTKVIPEIKVGHTIHLSMTWMASKPGISYLTIDVAPFQTDNVRENNIVVTPITIIGTPDIWINETSLEFIINEKGIITKSLKIGNNGTEKLAYHLTDNYSPEIFFDDMENGVNGWTHQGAFDSWEIGQPSIGPNKAFSGYSTWGTDLSGNYDDETNSSLISPIISLKKRIEPTLTFHHWYSINSYGDRGFVEIWNGSSWFTFNENSFSGQSRGWIQESFDLSLFNDQIIQMRFRLEADEHVVEKGWFIDDVSITEKVELIGDDIIESPNTGEIAPDAFETIIISVNASKFTAGSYLEYLTIRSNDPDESRITIPLEITLNETDNGGLPPLDIGPDIEVNEDEIIVFNGSKYYTELNILDYTWTLLDETLQVLKGVSPTYVFENPGIYEMTLIVTDYEGNQASDNLTITVRDITKPIPDAGEDLQINVENIVTLNAGQSIDNTGIISYTWDFGDGRNGSGLEVIHSYSEPGIYNISLTIKDADGNTNIDYMQIKVSPPATDYFLILISIGFIFMVIWVIYREMTVRAMKRIQKPKPLYSITEFFQVNQD